MPSKSQVAKTNPEQQQLSAPQQRQSVKRTEEHEYEASASASTAINLNIFAAMSGVFSGWSKKKTETDADGKTHETEDKHEQSRVRSAQHTTMNVVNTASSSRKARHRITEEGTAEENHGKAIEGESQHAIEDAKK